STGVKVWLDDFGTGFSGLSHLRRVPADGVKIDRSFISDVLRDPDDLALTTAIIARAQSQGITAVAEGVEKEGQYAILREHGCDLTPRYWNAHPVPVDEVDTPLASGRIPGPPGSRKLRGSCARLIRFPGKPAPRPIRPGGLSPRTPFVAQARSGASGAVKQDSLAARFKERSG